MGRLAGAWLLCAAALLPLSQANWEICCPALQLAIGPDKVFYSNSTGYEESTLTYFAVQQGELAPYCYVKPTCAQEVSDVVKALEVLNFIEPICPFAVRGGGHHTVVGISNIDAGVTIDLSYINATTLNPDKSIAHVGSGARWGTVYSTLSADGLAVVGGRESDIGVGGLTSGGGISYFGPQYGFACDTVQNFEIVLANGWIANANAHENPDLFVALKGGSNNFGIITRFDMKTFKLGNYFGGMNYYLEPQSPALLDAFYYFVANPDFDPKSNVFMTAVYAGASGAVVTTVDFAYTEAITDPPVFQNFTAIPAYVKGTSISNLATFSDQLSAYQSNGLRETSITATIRADRSLLQQVHQLWSATIATVKGAENLVYSLTSQPVAKSMITTGKANGGNSLGLNAADGPLVVFTLTASYTDAASDELIVSTSRSLFSQITEAAKKANALNPWIYYNYADSTQAVIASYGKASVKNMKAVSARVDPEGFFQRIQPGGFKLWR